MKYKSLIYIIATTLLILYYFPLKSQQWETMNDSTYYTIINQRLCKNNIITGLGGTIKVGHGDESFVSYGIRPQFGYFVYDKWLLLANIEYYNGTLNVTDENKQANYSRLFAGINIRYYLKPKARTFFFQVGSFLGNQTQDNGGYTELDNFDDFAVGIKGAAGYSVFVRKFEVELLFGLAYSFTETTGYNSFIGGNIFQINLSYIFDRQHKRKDRNK